MERDGHRVCASGDYGERQTGYGYSIIETGGRYGSMSTRCKKAACFGAAPGSRTRGKWRPGRDKINHGDHLCCAMNQSVSPFSAYQFLIYKYTCLASSERNLVARLLDRSNILYVLYMQVERSFACLVRARQSVTSGGER